MPCQICALKFWLFNERKLNKFSFNKKRCTVISFQFRPFLIIKCPASGLHKTILAFVSLPRLRAIALHRSAFLDSYPTELSGNSRISRGKRFTNMICQNVMSVTIKCCWWMFIGVFNEFAFWCKDYARKNNFSSNGALVEKIPKITLSSSFQSMMTRMNVFLENHHQILLTI